MGHAVGFGKVSSIDKAGFHLVSEQKCIFILRNWVTSEMHHLFKLQEIKVYNQGRAWQTLLTKNNDLYDLQNLISERLIHP